MECPECKSKRIQFKAYRSNNRKQFRCKDCNSYFYTQGDEVTNDENKLEGDETGLKIEYKGGMSKTPEELLKDNNIDLEKWYIERQEVKSWSTPLKIDGKVVQISNYYVAVHLKPKVASNPRLPPLQQIQINVKSVEAKVKEVKDDYILFFGDGHFGFRRDVQTAHLEPFHNREVLSQILNIASHYQPSHIVMLGDMLDLPDWSDKFLLRPEFYWTTQPSIIELGWFIGKLRASCPDSKIVFLKGNHTDRVDKQIIKYFPQIYNLKAIDSSSPVISVESLMDFKGLNIEVIAPLQSYWIDDIEFIHGIKVRPGNTAVEVLKDHNNSIVFGHVHRIETQFKTIKDYGMRKIIFASSAGCTCHIDGRVPAYGIDNNWQNGCGLINKNDKYPQLIPLHSRILVGNNEFESYDYVQDLEDETKWNFK